MKILIRLLVFTSFSLFLNFNLSSQEIDVQFPEIVIQHITYTIEVHSPDSVDVKVGDKWYQNQFSAEGIIHLQTESESSEIPTVLVQPTNNNKTPFSELKPLVFKSAQSAIPLWFSIIPPLVAIFLALLFKEVVSSLLLGILAGALTIGFYNHGFWGGLGGFFTVSGTYLIEALNDSGHLSVIVFSVLIGGIVTVISKNGGMAAMVSGISKKATNAKRGQFATYFLGVAIFFDDYANTLVVGNTMRPITDRLKISREKLAYLVDSTAAPVAAIAFVTTWIGAELGYIRDGLKAVELSPAMADLTPYSIFLSSLSYSFYPILTLIFMFFLVKTGKDFGAMRKAELKARNSAEDQVLTAGSDTEELAHYTAKEGVKSSGLYALIPIGIIVFGTLIGLLYTGHDANVWKDDSLSFWRKLSNTIGNSDSYQALLWSSFASLVIAVLMSLIGKKLSLQESVGAAVNGFKGMLDAVIILILAWSLAEITEQMHTADFLTGLLSGNLDLAWIPAITFVLSAVVAFSTGSSWGTMAIMYPLCIPAMLTLGTEGAMAATDFLPIFYNAVACVLAGAVLGDHCSPISDTTILSSLATRCNHITHVKTQMPYALTVGAVALGIGIIPSAFGAPSWLCFILGVGALLAVIKFFGKTTEPITSP